MVNNSNTSGKLNRQISIGTDFSITKRLGSTSISAIQISRSASDLHVLVEIKEGSKFMTFDIRKSELLMLVEYLNELA